MIKIIIVLLTLSIYVKAGEFDINALTAGKEPEVAFKISESVSWSGRVRAEKAGSNIWVIAEGDISNSGLATNVAVYFLIKDKANKMLGCMQQITFPSFPIREKASRNTACRCLISLQDLNSVRTLEVVAFSVK